MVRGKMPLEHRLLHAHALNAARPRTLLAIGNAIDKRKRITMGQNLRNLIGIELHGLTLPGFHENTGVMAAKAKRIGHGVGK